MRIVHLQAPQPNTDTVRVARLTRHLAARLQDFGPGGPLVLECDQIAGLVRTRFPNRDTTLVLSRLYSMGGVTVAQREDEAVFYLSPKVSFEDLDYVWGLLFQILS